jgi:hypothetical protein
MQALYTSARCISCDWPPSPGYCRCASAMHLRIAASRAWPCCAVCVAACGLASITAGHTHGLFPQFWLPEPGRQPAPGDSSRRTFGAMACNPYCVVRSGSPSMRLMDGGLIHIIVRASCVRTAESTHVSCTEDAMVEQSQVRDGLFEITSRYRSFDPNHAPHVCGNNMRRSSHDAAEAATTRR